MLVNNSVLGVGELGQVGELIHSGRRLDLFASLPPHQVRFLLDKLGVDMDMYGYEYDETTLMATCGNVDKCC